MVAARASGIGKYSTDPTGTLLGRRYKDGTKAYFRYVHGIMESYARKVTGSLPIINP